MKMSLDALVTRLEVTQKKHEKILYAGFRGLGGIHFPAWKHLFTSDILGRHPRHSYHYAWGDAYANYKKIEDAIQDNPSFTPYQYRRKDKYWWVFQMFCPIALKDELPIVQIHKENKTQDCGFVPGHYTQQARWRLCHPGALATLDDITLAALEKRKTIDAELDKLRTDIDSTRTMNDLDELFHIYDGDNFERILNTASERAYLKKLDRTIIERRKDIADQIRFSAKDFDQCYRLNYEARTPNKREHSLRLEGADWTFLEDAHMADVDYYLNLNWLFLDIEIPHFRRSDPQISWVGLKAVQGDLIVPEIHTIYDPNLKNIAGYNMIIYPDAFAMNQGVADRINDLDPDVISAYNSKFDLTKLRESIAGFPVGEDGTPPLFKATAPFFERMGIKDRLVIDFMRIQQISRPFDPNAKLEMAAGLEKISSYDDLEADEDRAIVGDRKAMIKSATYLAGDVDATAGMKDTDEFRKNLEDAIWICGTYNVGLDRILHTTNSINDVQERGFFENIGTYRDLVPPHIRYKDSQKREQQARSAFHTHVVGKGLYQDGKKPKGKKGLFRDVYKVYIPSGDFFRAALARRFEHVELFFNYKDGIRDDKQRLFFLEQYAKSFSRWIVTDYGFFIREVRKLFKMIKEKKIKIHDDPYKDMFEEDYHTLRRALEDDDLERLNQARLTQKAVSSYVADLEITLTEMYGVSVKELTEMANIRSKIKRVGRRLIGNYDLFSDRRYFQPKKKRKKQEPLVLEDIVTERFDEIKTFIKDNDIDFIAQEGHYIYLTGDRKVLEHPDAPLVIADDIPVLYNADNAYYKKNNYFAHMKVLDNPYFHSCVFEMQTMGNILDLILEDCPEEAIKLYMSALQQLEDEDVPVDELLMYNKSKGRYSAFVMDSPTERGDIFFAEDLDVVVEDIESQYRVAGEAAGHDRAVYLKRDDKPPQRRNVWMDKERNIEFYIDGARKAKKNKDEQIDVYLMDREELAIDYDQYRKRLLENGKGLLKPLVDKSLAKALWGTTRGAKDPDENQLSLF